MNTNETMLLLAHLSFTYQIDGSRTQSIVGARLYSNGFTMKGFHTILEQ